MPRCSQMASDNATLAEPEMIFSSPMEPMVLPPELAGPELAGVVGLEPTNDGTKTRCLTTLATPQHGNGHKKRCVKVGKPSSPSSRAALRATSRFAASSRNRANTLAPLPLMSAPAAPWESRRALRRLMSG